MYRPTMVPGSVVVSLLFTVTPIVLWGVVSFVPFLCAVLSIISSFAVIFLGTRELVSLL